MLGLPHQLESNECPDSDGVGAPFGLLFRRRIVDIFGCKPYDPFDVFVRNVPDFVLIEADCDRVAVLDLEALSPSAYSYRSLYEAMIFVLSILGERYFFAVVSVFLESPFEVDDVGIAVLDVMGSVALYPVITVSKVEIVYGERSC